MNVTGIENRLDKFAFVMKGIADDLHYFKKLCEQKMKEEEASKDEDREHEMYKKRELARNLIAHKGDGFIVCDDFVVPSSVEPNPHVANTVKKGERLTVENVDCLSNRYDVAVTVFRNDCGISIVLSLDQIRKLIENDILQIVGKVNA